MAAVAILTISGLSDERQAEMRASLTELPLAGGTHCLFAGLQTESGTRTGSLVLALGISSGHDVQLAMTHFGIADTEPGLTVQVMEAIQLEKRPHQQLLFP